MNIFTKLFLTASIAASSFVTAQQDSISITNLPSTIDKNYSFDGLWRISNDGNTSNYIISGGKLTNNSSKSSGNIYLDLYFVPSKATVQLENLPHKINTRAELGSLEGNGTSFNNVIITFKGNDIRNFNQGEYSPILLLKERESGKILNYKLLNNSITLETNNIFIDKKMEAVVVSTPTGTNISMPAPTEDYDKNFENLYRPVQSTLEVGGANQQIRLGGMWNLEIDFESLMVKVGGINNSIQNLVSKPTEKLKLMVYFAKQPLKNINEIDGYELLYLDVFPIAGNSRLEKPVFTTNITKLIPAGEYYPILVLTERKKNGEYVIKSTLSLGEKYVWQ